MANAGAQSVTVRCASGRCASFVKDSGTSATTYELVTGGNDLNQTAGVSFGDALANETVTHAFSQVNAIVSEAICFGGAWVTSPQGDVAAVIQGGGEQPPVFPALYRPLRVQVGMVLKGIAENGATSVVRAFAAVCYANGKHDIFSGTMVDATSTALTSVISGASWGQAGAGTVAVAYYAIFNNTNTINEDNNGTNFLYAQDAQGQLKGFMPPVLATNGIWTEFVTVPIPIHQNDTLKGTYAT